VAGWVHDIKITQLRELHGDANNHCHLVFAKVNVFVKTMQQKRQRLSARLQLSKYFLNNKSAQETPLGAINEVLQFT